MVDAPVTRPSVTWETPDRNTPCGAYPSSQDSGLSPWET